MMKKSLFLLIVCSTVSLFSQEKQISPQAAYQKLIEGNQRFASGKSIFPDRTAERRLETAVKQKPFAVVLGCSDSRASPEIIFDQGIGDLFIVRVAGNVIGETVLDSIEYAVLYLDSVFILVLGHENCGAVEAVLEGKTRDIEAVALQIQPAADLTEGQTEKRLENTVKANVNLIVNNLKKTEVLKDLLQKKKINIVGGYYDFHEGKVEFLN
jgi:carbonic anhydrase